MTTKSLRSLGLAVLVALMATAANAQTTATPASPSSDSDLRLATTTADGDTGLWYVPTAEVLARGKWSISGYRVGLNYKQGFTNVADFPITFGVGVANHTEVFASFKAVTRIDRDLRPLFNSNADVGGVIGRYPLVTRGWSGNQVGDLEVGVKYSLMSEADQKPAAVALRGILKLPTGNTTYGVSTGKPDGSLDLVVSKENGQAVEVSGYVGAIVRGKPDGASESGGFRYGFGAGFPARKPLRLTAEFTGEKPFNRTTTLSTPLIAADGSVAPLSSTLTAFNAVTLGLTWQDRRGFFVGAGMTWNMPTADRGQFTTDDNRSGDFVDYQFRIGYHPGVRKYVAPVPEPKPEPRPEPKPVNRPPTVTAQCDPCTVEVGKTSTVTAIGQDPDGDTLTYRWRAATGTFQNPAERVTVWTAPMQEGPVQTIVTADDGKGGTASAFVTIQVVRPAPIVELNFEDVYFDFDRSTLRPDALRLLDDAVAKLQANPTKNMIIEGHTCNIGTAEYNLALGERRARSVVDYLTSRGVAASRLETRSYGEESPKFDNAREETRRLNRRAALVVKVQ